MVTIHMDAGVAAAGERVGRGLETAARFVGNLLVALVTVVLVGTDVEH